jgi:hypothetical protein
MNENLIFINEQIVECETYLFITRDSNLQREACEHLELLYAQARALKIQAIAEADEPQANILLGFECVITAVRDEICMWLYLKNGEPEKAWDRLVGAQSAIAAAARSDRGFAHLSRKAAHLEAIEQTIFPPQVFVSSGFIVERQTCSICGEEYGECDHLAGLPYMGEFCGIVASGLTVDHSAVVKNPADKRCRITSFRVKNGVRNRMTWKVEPASQDAEQFDDENTMTTTAILCVASGPRPWPRPWIADA